MLQEVVQNGRKVFIGRKSMEQEVKKKMDYFSQGYLPSGDYRGFYQAIYLTSIDQKISDWFKIILLGKELRRGGAYKK